MFFDLAIRLPAYEGVMAARARAEMQDQDSAPARPRQQSAARPQEKPPATSARLTEINAKLGAQWFSHVTVPANG